MTKTVNCYTNIINRILKDSVDVSDVYIDIEVKSIESGNHLVDPINAYILLKSDGKENLIEAPIEAAIPIAVLYLDSLKIRDVSKRKDDVSYIS